MLDQWFQIGRVWAMRPLMWIVLLIVGFIGLVSLDPKTSVTTKAYSDATSARRWRSEALRHSDDFFRAVDRDQVDPSVHGIDFDAIGSLTRPVADGNLLVPMSELGDAFELFPNLQWIRFGQGQLAEMRPGTLSGLSKVTAASVSSIEITEAELQRLVELRALEELVIETVIFDTTLQPLTELPQLNKLVLSNGHFQSPGSISESLFRREVLEGLTDLTNIETLVLDPSWMPGDATFVGTPPDEWDTLVKQNAGEILPDLPKLRRLWIGYQLRPIERANLEAIAIALPGVSVSPARFDLAKITKMLGGCVFGFILTLLIGLNLTSNFSSSSAMLIPGYAAPHRHFFLAAIAVLLAIGVLALTSVSLIAPLPVLACLLVVVAVTVLCHVHLGIFVPRGNDRLGWLLFAVFVVPYALKYVAPSLRSFGPAIDRFQMGLHPILASVIACVSLLVIVRCVRLFAEQHRVFAESSISPSVTFFDLQEQQFSVYKRFKGMSVFERRANLWEKKFALVAARVAEDSRWARVIRWAYASMGHDSIKRVAWVVIAFSIVAVWLSMKMPSSPRGNAESNMFVLFFTVGVASSMHIAFSSRDRKIYSMELLLPIRRDQFVKQRFTIAFVHCASCLLIAYAGSLAVHWYLFGFPTVGMLARGIIAIGLLAVYSTAATMLLSLIRNVFVAAMLVLIQLPVIAFTCVLCSGRRAVFFSQEFVSVLHHWSILPVGALIAIAMLTLSYRYWNQAEFGINDH